MIKIEVDEEKDRNFIRRKARELRLKPYYERNVTYKEVEEKIKERALINGSMILLIATLSVCYVLANCLVNKEFIAEDINLIIGVIATYTIGIISGLLMLVSSIREIVNKDYNLNYDLQTIEENK
jgi:hypothetical protein